MEFRFWVNGTILCKSLDVELSEHSDQLGFDLEFHRDFNGRISFVKAVPHESLEKELVGNQ